MLRTKDFSIQTIMILPAVFIFFSLKIFAQSGSWSQKQSLVTAPAAGDTLIGFSVGDRGYIAPGGQNAKEFWEYNPLTNSWAQKANFAGIGRSYAVGFAIGSKGYFGTGVRTK